jgi:hypothetical protein
MTNTAYLPHSLYFNSIYSPNINIFPWVLYHIREKQIRFMWFDGPNEPDTKEPELRMLPLGASMKMLSMHKGSEIQVDNSISKDNLVLASYEKNRIVVQAINLGLQRNVEITLQNITGSFPELAQKKIKVVKYLIDSHHSNFLAKPEYTGGLEKIEESMINVGGIETVLQHKDLEENGIVLWEIIE